MSKFSVLNAILNKTHPNSVLLKKFILLANQGWLRINGQAPDKQFSLADYLFDNENIILDTSRLNDVSKQKFNLWFKQPHTQDAKRVFLNGYATNEYRGYTAETAFSWWGRLVNFLFYKKKAYQWSLAPLQATFGYQLMDLEIAQGKNGLLVSLNQFANEDLVNKYHAKEDDQAKPLRNTKRILLSNKLIDDLVKMDLNAHAYDELLVNPHPYSVSILPEQYKRRFEAMHDYRQTERFIALHPWYIRLVRIFGWMKSWFSTLIQNFLGFKKPNVLAAQTQVFTEVLFKDEKFIVQRRPSGEITIMEKRPNLDYMVFCGGGAKIFAHVGSYRAFEEVNISPASFSGSSAGAIMAMLCYIGCTSTEIKEFFQLFRKENLIFNEADRNGISTKEAMKAGLDYMLIKKVKAIISKYQIDETEEGRAFLNTVIFPHGIISFASLSRLKERYPECGLGEHLVVTATNKKQRRTYYYSYTLSPHDEISEKVSTSASMPVAFKPSIFSDGEMYTDGGILSNLPTEVFPDDHSTFLSSEHGSCLRLVAFQFDNGPERDILTKVVDRVYRQNFFVNWIYSLLTGVKDPASAWELDLVKLLHHSPSVILVNTGNIASTQFELDDSTKEALMGYGYEAAKEYINIHYPDENASTHEHLYASFCNIEELLYYCCYRQREDWFDTIAVYAKTYVMDDKITLLRQRHFPKTEEPEVKVAIVEPINEIQHDLLDRMDLFLYIYPILLKMPLTVVRDPINLHLYKKARHSLTIQDPAACVKTLANMTGDIHILLAILIKLVVEYCPGQAKEKTDLLIQQLKIIEGALTVINKESQNPSFWGSWHLKPETINTILNGLKNNEATKVKQALAENRKKPIAAVLPNETRLPVIKQESELEREDAYHLLY